MFMWPLDHKINDDDDDSNETKKKQFGCQDTYKQTNKYKHGIQ